MEGQAQFKFGRGALLVIFCFLVFAALAVPALAQNSALVAFVNSSGQLVVSSGDGGYRWIVTNPGETVVGDPVWTANGQQVLFAVNSGGAVSVRAASISQQAVGEVGAASPGIISLSPDGAFAFGQQTNGAYSLVAQGAGTPLPLTNDAAARYSGLWADALPLVAYWGYAGNSALAVTNAATGQTSAIDSGRSSPVLPLLWLPGTAQLVFRDADGQIRLADFSCLQSTCSGSPDQFNIRTLASGDADVASDDNWLFFRTGSTISAVDLACVATDSCLSSAVPVAANAAPQTPLSAAGGILVYTGFAQNANDPNDREVRGVNLACLNSGGCAGQTIATAARAGALAASGRFVVVESASGLESLDLSTGSRAYLSDRGAPLEQARWQ